MANLHFVFQDFPGPDNRCVFVEVETPEGRSINAGDWRKRADGLAEFVVRQPDLAGLRDAIAGQAMLGMITSRRADDMGYDELASRSYRYADAMLRARQP